MGRSRELGRALRGRCPRWECPAGGARRGAGLRRDEPAPLAVLSVDHVVRLEQGLATSPRRRCCPRTAAPVRRSPQDVTATHLYAPGLKLHMRNAVR
ncbi:hypothetical protein [Nonomuraea terrae]|uniref:hypothetical protein n=1 Tax=Nonomuraea terrae TaxID=2530383 RepID=UPI001CB6F5E0